MTIGIDASRANHEQKTGVEWYAWYVIQELKKIISDDVRVLLYSDAPLVGELAILPAHWESHVLSWPPKRLWTQVRLSFEMLMHPPDVLFIPAHVVPLIHPKKTVMTVHDIAATRFPETYNSFERWYTLWSAKYALKKLWKVIVPSASVKSELTSAFGLRALGTISVIPHGYDTRYQEIGDEKKINFVLEKYNIRQPFFLSIGRLEEKKNTRRIVEAFNLIKSRSPKSEVQLVLVGQPGHGYERVRKAIVKSPYCDGIKELGWVGKEDLPFLVQGATTFVFPSLLEGFGLPILEAFAAGTPVLTSRGGATEEVSGTGALFVDPVSVEEIAHGMQSLLESQELRTNFIAKGEERVRAYSWVTCAADTWDILRS